MTYSPRYLSTECDREYMEEPEPLDLDLLKEDLLSDGMTPRQVAKFIVTNDLDLEV